MLSDLTPKILDGLILPMILKDTECVVVIVTLKQPSVTLLMFKTTLVNGNVVVVTIHLAVISWRNAIVIGGFIIKKHSIALYNFLETSYSLTVDTIWIGQCWLEDKFLGEIIGYIFLAINLLLIKHHTI